MWTGIFHCDICKLQESLDRDEAVACRECGELMVPGPLFSEEIDGPPTSPDSELRVV
jgi:hypothetical protein